MFLDESEYLEGEQSVSDQINAVINRNFDRLYSFDVSSSTTGVTGAREEFETIEL